MNGVRFSLLWIFVALVAVYDAAFAWTYRGPSCKPGK